MVGLSVYFVSKSELFKVIFLGKGKVNGLWRKWAFKKGRCGCFFRFVERKGKFVYEAMSFLELLQPSFLTYDKTLEVNRSYR